MTLIEALFLALLGLGQPAGETDERPTATLPAPPPPPAPCKKEEKPDEVPPPPVITKHDLIKKISNGF